MRENKIKREEGALGRDGDRVKERESEGVREYVCV